MLRYLVLALVALLTMGAALAGGCGKDDPVGEYECVGGELQTLFEDMSLVLVADGTATLTGVDVSRMCHVSGSVASAFRRHGGGETCALVQIVLHRPPASPRQHSLSG